MMFKPGIIQYSSGGEESIGNVTSGSGSFTYYGEVGYYPADGRTHWIVIRAYKTVGGSKIYSDTPFETAHITDNGTYDPDANQPQYKITWSWGAVDGAEGYEIQKYSSWTNWAVYETETTDTSIDDFEINVPFPEAL